ncbi:MAG: TerC/Alx family metal homeostasis membrane protein [Bacteroidota bacterium]
MPLKKAIYWTIFWFLLSMTINLIIYYFYGTQKALEFLTGYVIEESLSIDNLFVFLFVFKVFGVEQNKQRRILNYGILGVILMRGIIIFVGATLINEFNWILYFFGFLLIYTGYYMVVGEEKELHPEKNPIVKYFKRFFPVLTDYEGKNFFVRKDKILYATPLFIVLIVIETTDLVFAIDSIPAIFAITKDPLIVFSSNLMAVLGLRSLYFVLDHIQRIFKFVKFGVGVVLVFVGIKMLLMDIYHINIYASLFIVLTILTLSVVASYIIPEKKSK